MIDQFVISHRERSFYMNYVNNQAWPCGMPHFHLHDDYEIYFLMNGTRTYIINDTHYTIRPNNLVFIDRNVIHKTVSPKNPEHERIVINFQSRFIPTGAQSLVHALFQCGPHVIGIPSVKQAYFRLLLKKMQEEYALGLSDQYLCLQSLLVQLLIESGRLVQRSAQSTQAKSAKNNSIHPTVYRILTFINHNYRHNISLRDVAQRFVLSGQYVGKLFRKTTGTNVTTYINNVRIHEAQRLLQESEKQVSEISSEVGFSNTTHFYRVFKKNTHMSPSDYRKQHVNKMCKGDWKDE